MSCILKLAMKCAFGVTFPLTLLAFVSSTHAATFRLLYSFTGSASDGGNPAAAMVRDAKGNLYGTTGYNTGTVFRLAPDGTVTVLHVFSGGSDGDEPGGLVMDGKGNLWGTALAGGDAADAGVIFEIDRTGKEKTVYTFQGAPKDGAAPVAALTKGDDGNFYGTTTVGGRENRGTAFSLTTGDHEMLLHSFRSGRGGNYPLAGLLTDGNGNLYGVNEIGGVKDSGTVFKLDPAGRETVLYAFKGLQNDASEPDGTLISDASGNFYGTLLISGRAGCGGEEGCGAVFELTPSGTETILHFFTGKHGDGGNPLGGVIADGTGNLYGTTLYGGGHCQMDVYGCGTVFSIAPDSTETILYSFSTKNGADGELPEAGLVADRKGHYYGTAISGGAYGYGTIFEITP